MNYEDEMILKELMKEKYELECVVNFYEVFGTPENLILAKEILNEVYIKLGFSTPTITQEDLYDMYDAEDKDSENWMKYI